MGQTRDSSEQDPRGSGERLGGCGLGEPRQQAQRERSGSPGPLWLCVDPAPGLASTWESLSSAGEASSNLHQGVKLHTAAGQWPTAPARCVNTRGPFLALQVGLGGTYFSRGAPERRDLPGASGQGLRSVGSSPTRGAACRAVPSRVGGGTHSFLSGTWLIDSPKQR